jgi:putative membrane protein
MAVDAPARPGLRAGAVPALFALAALAEVAYPLVHGTARDALTAFIVVVVAAASLTHAGLTRGPRAVIVLAAVTIVGGFAVEVLGVHTGVPFGRYEYGDSLGPSVAGVPLLIACAWTMLAWPAALAARRLARTFPGRVALGAWALAAWDLFLDPQMVADGHWHWLDPAPHLPGVPTVPLSDYLGWLIVSVVVSLALQFVLVDSDGDDRWPLAFYLWTWVSSALALAAFLDLAAAAGWGLLAMGTVGVPLARSLTRSR